MHFSQVHWKSKRKKDSERRRKGGGVKETKEERKMGQSWGSDNEGENS